MSEFKFQQKFQPGDRIKFLGGDWAATLKGNTGTIIEERNDVDFGLGYLVHLDTPRKNYYNVQKASEAFLPCKYDYCAEFLSNCFTEYERLRREDP